MRLLLDTHALIWFLAGDAKLPARARTEIEEPTGTVFVSAVSAIEVVTKHRLGKLSQAEALARDFEFTIQQRGFEGLPIALRHAELAGNLPIDHRDPFDRILIAQSLLEGLTLVSNERLFDASGINRLWGP